MDNARRQKEYAPESSENALISYESANRYLKRKGLGNYAKDIYQHLSFNLERAEQQGTSVNVGYAFTALHNLAASKLKGLDYKRKLENKLREAAKAQTTTQIDCPQKIVAQTELKEMVNQIIEELDLRERTVLRLRLFTDYKFTYSEIGGIIGYSPSMARVIYNNAIQFIENRLNHMSKK